MRETYNGGITLGIGSYTLRCISEYKPKWTHEIDKSFENWDFTMVEEPKGRRFSADITTGYLNEEEMNKLIKILIGRTFTFSSTEFTGTVSVVNVPKTYKVANTSGKIFTCSFSVAAVGLEGSGGSL